jgi:hypothetical protein
MMVLPCTGGAGLVSVRLVGFGRQPSLSSTLMPSCGSAPALQSLMDCSITRSL